MNKLDCVAMMSQQRLEEMMRAYELIKEGRIDESISCLDKVLSLSKGVEIILDDILAELG